MSAAQAPEPRQYPASLDLLERTKAYPMHSAIGGNVTGFAYSRDELAALLAEVSRHVSIGVHDIEHGPDGDMTSMKITVYLTLARSEYRS